MPKILKKPENVECTEFDDVKFEISVSGKPEPTVEWYFHSLCTHTYRFIIFIVNFIINL